MGGTGSGRKPTKPHGTMAAYQRGCRCDRCRVAWRRYVQARREKVVEARRQRWDALFAEASAPTTSKRRRSEIRRLLAARGDRGQLKTA